MKILIASHNPKKTIEMQKIMQGTDLNIDWLTWNNFSETVDPEETGTTMVENAIIKAEAACKLSNIWSISDDGGLEIDALGGEPGVHSKRFAGEETSFPDKMEIILELLEDVPKEKRTARFRCCVALARANHETIVFEDICEGEIAFEPKGQFGFGYDPIFWLPSYECTMASLTRDQKATISARGKVLNQLKKYLKENI